MKCCFNGFLLFLLVVCAFPVVANAEREETFFIFDTPMLSDTSAMADIYVSPDGLESNSGTFESPVQSLTEAVRRAVLSTATDGVTIWLRGGQYYLDETLYISSDIGKSLTFRAYPGETPVITGAQRVTQWVEASHMGKTVWAAHLGLSEVRALYGENGARPISRWPKQGTLKVTKAEKKTDDKFEHHYAFYLNQAEVPTSLQGAMVRLLHWWKDELSGVRAYDSDSGYLLMNRQSSMTIAKDESFWLENVLSATLNDGEWAYDAMYGTLYYAPLEGETMEGTPLYVGTTEQLIRVSGISNITFDGITFARTAWTIPYYDTAYDFPQAAYDANAAIYVSEARNITISSCNFRDIGSGCIRFDTNVKDSVVYNCTFEEIGAHAVYLHGQNISFEELVTEGITIENNAIRGYGRNFYNAAAVLVVHARNVSIGFNEIHDGTYTAISAGWVWGTGYSVTSNIEIRNNLIYNIGQGLLSDMGAIYLLGSQPFTTVTGNIIHSVSAYDYGGWGIYLDEGSNEISVTNNLVYNCSAQGFHQHNGVSNTVQNNIFAFNGDGQVGISGSGRFLLERNVVVGGKPYLNQKNTGTIRSVDNLFRASGTLFVDADNENYNLKDSTAQDEIGFIPWVFMAGRYSQ